MSNTALFVSPHFDDVAFSCGGTAVQLARRGWTTHLVTVFSAGVYPATGFALACQTDKGLGEEVDYMLLRKGEDDEAAGFLQINQTHRLGFLEAPHRGYESAKDLFAAVQHSDRLTLRKVTATLAKLVESARPDVVFAPLAIGNHVDHVIVGTAARNLGVRTAWYRDTPYVIRDPHASTPLPVSGEEWTATLDDEALNARIDASAAYKSQLGFQFQGSKQAVREALTDLAISTGGGEKAEAFLGEARELVAVGPSSGRGGQASGEAPTPPSHRARHEGGVDKTVVEL